MGTEENIRKIVEEIIKKEPDLFIVEVKLKNRLGVQHLSVILDGDKGILIDQCADISRKLSYQIDEKNLIEGKYNLEVSSAGIGNPLKLARQYKKNQNRNVDVKLVNGKKIRGKLLKNSERGILVAHGDKEIEINFREIEKTVVAISFK